MFLKFLNLSQIKQRAGINSGSLSAKARMAEGNGDTMMLLGEGHFFGREIAFRPDKNDCIGAGLKHLF